MYLRQQIVARCLSLLALVIAISLGSGTGAARADMAAPDDTGGFHMTDAQLRRLAGETLDRNPRLRGAQARARAASQQPTAASALPDPRVAYRYFVREPETRVGPQRHGIELTQVIPWRGKRRVQADAAERLAQSSAWTAADVARGLIQELKRMYFEAAYLQQAINVVVEEKLLLERFEDAALRRYATGEGQQQSVIRLQTDISRLADRREELADRLRRVERRVAALTGDPSRLLELAPISLSEPPLPPTAAELRETSFADHPALLAASFDVEARRSLLSRRQLEKRPDITLGVGYTIVARRDDPAGIANPPADNGKDVLGVTLGINIPLNSNRIRAEVEEATLMQRSAESALHASRDRVLLAAQDASLELEALHERLRLQRDVILPQARQALASTEAAYSRGSLPLIDLLDAERTLLQVRLAVHRLTADAWAASASLEYALGRAFPDPDPDLMASRESGGALR
jgi:outer membrane protein TolC